MKEKELTTIAEQILATDYISSMDEKMKREIFRKFADFISSDKAKEVGKQDSSLAGKIRTYRSRYNKDELNELAALSLLLECGQVDEIKFKEDK